MLTIVVPAHEWFDSSTNSFVYTKEQKLQLEHSLVSISKWESKWHKAFLGKDAKTNEEMLDYVRCMTITQNVNPDVYSVLTPQNMADINHYIEDDMTATWFSEDKNQKHSREIITNEIIYYWMIALQIPMKCEKWHLNRLLTLIRVCNIKNTPPKKMGKRSVMNRNRALNAQRRKALGSKG